MVIGSANLTFRGLNNNIEAGMLLDFDLTDAADKAMIDNIENLFASCGDTDYFNHVVKVGKIADLDEMLTAGRLIDELTIVRHPDFSGRADTTDSEPDFEIANGSESGGVPRIKLKVKTLQSGVSPKTKTVQNELDDSKAPEVTPKTISLPGFYERS